MSVKIVVDIGKSYMGTIVMTGTGGDGKLNNKAVCHLYTNNYTPVENSVLGDFTEMTNAEVPGYAAQTLGTATNGGIDGSDRDTWTWPTLTFQATGAPPLPQICYGAFFTDSTGTVLLWAELFPSPFTFTNSGDGFTLIPTMSFGSIY